MKKQQRRILLMVLSVLTSAAIALTGGLFSLPLLPAEPLDVPTRAIASSSAPESAALECISEGASDVKLLGVQAHRSEDSSQTHRMTYYLFSLISEGEQQEVAILDFNGVCGTSYNSAWGQTLSEQVDMSVARSLRLQAYRTIAESIGGIEALKQEVMQSVEEPSLDGSLPSFSPENIWALEQLGIFPPEGSYTVQEIEPYVPGQLNQ
jgi:hypothetical protein